MVDSSNKEDSSELCHGDLNDEYNNRMGESEKDNRFLREHVTRLTKELSACQKICGTNVRNVDDHGIEFPRWMLSVDSISPLFLAYDLRIEELGLFMEEQGAHLDTLTQRCDILLKENESMRKKTAISIGKVQAPKISSEMIMTDSIDGINTKKLLVDENELLMQQSELLVKELDISNMAVSVRDKTITVLNKEIAHKLDLVKKYENKIRQLETEKSTCENELLTHIQHANKFKVEVGKLNSHVGKNEANRCDLMSQLKSIKAEKIEYENEAQELSNKAIVATSRIHDLQTRIFAKSSELDKLNQTHVQIVKTLARSDKDKKDMERELVTMRQRVAEYIRKEEDLDRMKHKNKERLEETTLSRDKLEATCNSLHEKIKLLSNRRAEDCKYISTATEKRLAALKEKQCLELESRDKMMSEMNLQNSRLSSQVEQSVREKDYITKVHKKFERSIKMERDTVNDHVNELEKVLTDARVKIAVEDRSKQEVINEKAGLEKKHDSLHELLSIAKSDMRRAQEGYKRKINELTEVESKLQSEVDDMSWKFQNDSSKWEEETVCLKQEMETAIKERDTDAIILRTKIMQLEESNNLSVEFLKNQRIDHEKNMLELQNVSTVLTKQLEQKLHEERESSQICINENHQLLTNIQNVKKEALELSLIVKENDMKLFNAGNSIRKTEETVLLLGKQLNESLSDQQERIESERKIKRDYVHVKAQLADLKEMIKVDSGWAQK